MYRVVILILSILSLSIVAIHSHSCSCSCCLGSGCTAINFADPVDAQQCTDTSCVAACKARYYQCNAPSGQGQTRGYCLSSTTTASTPSSIIGGPYSCQCNCCNTGTYQCIASYVGSTNAYSCTEGACSVSCAKNYPYICLSNERGRTEGFCTGMIASTTNAPARTVRCGCGCTGSSGYQTYEVISTAGCSDCFRACQSIHLQCYTHQNNYCQYY